MKKNSNERKNLSTSFFLKSLQEKKNSVILNEPASVKNIFLKKKKLKKSEKKLKENKKDINKNSRIVNRGDYEKER